jgi:hypothetical protein
LCCLGFPIRDDAEPVSVTIDVEAQTPVVIFWHSPEPVPESPVLAVVPPLTLVAIDVEAWWRYPGKFSIPGFDDALSAIRKVFEAREWLLSLIWQQRLIVNQRFSKNAVVTGSLHYASAIKASGFDLIAFEKGPGRGNDRFVFPAKAVKIVELIDAAERTPSHLSPLTSHERPSDADPCVDWMLWALKYHDRLARMVKQAAAMPMIEMREGDHVMRLNAKMPRALKRDFMRHW